MKNFLIGVWILFTAQTFFSYVEVRKEVGSFMTRDMYERCHIAPEMDWSLLRVKYSLECEKETV